MDLDDKLINELMNSVDERYLIDRLKEMVAIKSENPFDEREVQSLFNQIRSLLGEIEAERQRMRDMKDTRFEGV